MGWKLSVTHSGERKCLKIIEYYNAFCGLNSVKSDFPIFLQYYFLLWKLI